MTLPSSGSISLNQMHIEVGGSSGSQVSINDSDIRGLIGKSSGATMSFNEWYGASSFTADTQIDVTNASSGQKNSVPEFRTYTMVFVANGTVHNNDILYTSGGTTYYIHGTSGSTLASASTFYFSSNSTPTSGGGSASHFNGKYWRIPSTYNDGTTTGNISGVAVGGNWLISNGTTHTDQDLASPPNNIFTGFKATISSINCPVGQTANKRATYNIY